MISKYISLILNQWNTFQIKSALNCLIIMRKYIVDNLHPGKLSFQMLDFMTDESMWDWIESTQLSSSYDYQAAYLVFQNLQELYNSNNIILETV